MTPTPHTETPSTITSTVRFGCRSTAVPLDRDDPTTFGPALAGVGAVHLANSPDPVFPGAATKPGAFVSAAADVAEPFLDRTVREGGRQPAVADVR